MFGKYKLYFPRYIHTRYENSIFKLRGLTTQSTTTRQ